MSAAELGLTNMVLQFGPREQRINFPFILSTDTFPEGTEAFLASSAPGHIARLPDGTRLPVSTYLNPISLSAESFVIIEDDDCEFLPSLKTVGIMIILSLAIIIVFEETQYTVSESVGTQEVFVSVFNPPDDLSLPTSKYLSLIHI